MDFAPCKHYAKSARVQVAAVAGLAQRRSGRMARGSAPNSSFCGTKPGEQPNSSFCGTKPGEQLRGRRDAARRAFHAHRSQVTGEQLAAKFLEWRAVDQFVEWPLMHVSERPLVEPAARPNIAVRIDERLKPGIEAIAGLPRHRTCVNVHRQGSFVVHSAALNLAKSLRCFGGGAGCITSGALIPYRPKLSLIPSMIPGWITNETPADRI